MKTCLLVLMGAIALPWSAPAAVTSPASMAPAERLGTVSFPVACASSSQPSFNRGVALLHDFWYEEAQQEFKRLIKADPGCAMAHWGLAMSAFHQIWDRPDQAAITLARRELAKAAVHPSAAALDRSYVAALTGFFKADHRTYDQRIDAYAKAMGQIHSAHPDDPDAGAFYALAVLAATPPSDTSLTHERQAMAVLTPLFARFPDHPGLVHYIIHACDTPALAADGLAAARHYGEIAASAPHAVHMPGHIFSRLGLWQADIDSQLASIEASHAAEARHLSGAMDQFHSKDFLQYAYLQSGQDTKARQLLNEMGPLLTHFEGMQGMAADYMKDMFPYYRNKFPVFFHLEMRDWKSAGALPMDTHQPPETQTIIAWAHAIAFGHLRDAARARDAGSTYETLIEQIRKGRHAYFADATSTQIDRDVIQGWVAFAEGKIPEAVKRMRAAADLQDRVGQGEVDIPAREMLGDVLLESGQAPAALIEYRQALKLSPDRFNGLANAARAAEGVGDLGAARQYRVALLKSTDNGSHSERSELTQAKAFLAQHPINGAIAGSQGR